jgi:uncharacterized protein HemY
MYRIALMDHAFDKHSGIDPSHLGSRSARMANLLEQAIECSDGDHAAKIIQQALGIETDDVANYVFPKTWPADREQRARIIGEWLQTEARFLA